MSNNASEARHIVCTVHAQTEHREQVKALLMELIEPARSEAGCLYYDLYQNTSRPDVFYIIDGWASEAAIEAHKTYPNVPRVVEQLLPLLAEPLDLAISAKVNV